MNRPDPDHVLRGWIRYRRPDAYVDEPAGYRYPDDDGETHALTFDNGFRVIKVWFTTVKKAGDLVRVRSQNWRCEHEPSGFMTRAQARKLYGDCILAGMTYEVRS